MRHCLSALFVIAFLAASANLAFAAAKPVYKSPVVNASTKGHAVDVEADITGAKTLYLIEDRDEPMGSGSHQPKCRRS